MSSESVKLTDSLSWLTKQGKLIWTELLSGSFDGARSSESDPTKERLRMTSSSNPDDRTVKELLRSVRTIAVVGLSTDPTRDSRKVAAYLKDHGYKIVPVNPSADEIMGEKSYPDLASIPEPVDVVDVFMRSERVPEIADQAIAINAKALWLQLGITNEEAARKARDAGLTVVQNACMLVEHSRLIG
jgi:predicted CoA-binding protein